MIRFYRKTPKLSAAKFRGQKSLVVDALSTFSSPVSLDALLPVVDENGRYNALLSDWARQNGGVKGSVLYHLRALKRLGMVEETWIPAPTKTQVVSWGNSQALRIPREILEALQIHEGDEVEMIVENGRLSVRPVAPKLTLEALVEAITPENLHGELEWGPAVGNEVW
jgi:antitoxin MazE